MEEHGEEIKSVQEMEGSMVITSISLSWEHETVLWSAQHKTGINKYLSNKLMLARLLNLLA